MTKQERKQHWEQIYNDKAFEACSWYQKTPSFSLKEVQKWTDQQSAIIDIGAGESRLTSHLFSLGYKDLSVLDISSKAIENAQANFGDQANKIRWIHSDVTDFDDSKKYDLWHDRAAFHFLTHTNDINTYVDRATASIQPGGYAIIGAFSDQGPSRCSGIEVQQYTAESMTRCFEKSFELIEQQLQWHITPFETQQAFCFCTFKKK